jgi:hypothetical protein
MRVTSCFFLVLFCSLACGGAEPSKGSPLYNERERIKADRENYQKEKENIEKMMGKKKDKNEEGKLAYLNALADALCDYLPDLNTRSNSENFLVSSSSNWAKPELAAELKKECQEMEEELLRLQKEGAFFIRVPGTLKWVPFTESKGYVAVGEIFPNHPGADLKALQEAVTLRRHLVREVPILGLTPQKIYFDEKKKGVSYSGTVGTHALIWVYIRAPKECKVSLLLRPGEGDSVVSAQLNYANITLSDKGESKITLRKGNNILAVDCLNGDRAPFFLDFRVKGKNLEIGETPK